MRYEDLQQALEVFCLPERATLKEIKARHRALVKRCHPDAGAADAERIREINEAYKVLTAYCGSYQFSFSHEEFLRQNPDEWFRHQFGKDPIWGG
ncbi:J domain-containing protein [Geoalkalibacter halelectricus]|uniref:J domain-containing protein n=1 Tax=Geoalkalibacter halelectricus TaxID=2847045 RepID=UPI0026707B02|nr:J domain-containing protein [Geoalkalibacter halelectricus]MDO3380340.1 J domain-containing protein [Geoalkalibacter halelectricus]